MKCDEVQTLHDPYLDSELDAKTSLEIERHLESCPACARLLAEEEKLEARIVAGLKRGQRTAALWEQIERRVAAAASASRARPTAHVSQPVGWRGALGDTGRAASGGLANVALGLDRTGCGVGGNSGAELHSARAGRAARGRAGSALGVRNALCLEAETTVDGGTGPHIRTGSGRQAEGGSAKPAQRAAQRNPERMRQL